MLDKSWQARTKCGLLIKYYDLNIKVYDSPKIVGMLSGDGACP